MAIINSYPTITPTSEDLLLVSDVSEEGNPTKTTTISDLIALIPPLVPGGGTMSSWKLTGDNAPIESTVSDGNTVDIEGGTKITTSASATTKLTINHDSTTRADTGSSASPGSGGTFTCIDTITQDSTGHPTAVNVKTITLPTSGTMSNWLITADNATTANVINGETVDIAGGTKITTAATLGQEVTVNHDTTTRSDTTSSASPAAGATFTCVDSITQDATGHPTAVNVKTVTMPAEDYLVYSALITQTGTNPPTAVVLKNTIPGTTAFAPYTTAGEYILRNNLTPFTANKVQVFLNRGVNDGDLQKLRWSRENTSEIAIKTSDSSGTANDLITNGSLEVRVYS
jgi:hypothetical protein|tara:strand:+ start:306 stop:1337 length:1032 start_codon:yes stop_codon:yes gene_type:complete